MFTKKPITGWRKFKYSALNLPRDGGYVSVKAPMNVVVETLILLRPAAESALSMFCIAWMRTVPAPPGPLGITSFPTEMYLNLTSFYFWTLSRTHVLASAWLSARRFKSPLGTSRMNSMLEPRRALRASGLGPYIRIRGMLYCLNIATTSDGFGRLFPNCPKHTPICPASNKI